MAITLQFIVSILGLKNENTQYVQSHADADVPSHNCYGHETIKWCKPSDWSND